MRSDLRARDLLYQYDALARFADAQHPPPGDSGRAQDARQLVTTHIQDFYASWPRR